MSRLQGKVVLVTGAAGGIGAAIVRRLASEGAKVLAADLDPPPDGVKLDVTKEAQWEAAFADIGRTFGRLDGLVNNAGLNRSQGGETPEAFQLDDLRNMFAVNFEGVALGCKHAIPLMAKSGGGSIVNMSSIAGLLPCDFIAAYGASKASVAHWTKSLALYCARQGHRTRCNSVHPGSVMTSMMTELFERMAAGSGGDANQLAEEFEQRIPLGFYQTPEDIAAAVLFLLSEDARAITGLELVVDGGMMLAN